MILGIDTGGTHVDAVLVDDGRIVDTAKAPNDGPREGVTRALSLLGADWTVVAPDRVVVATTVVANAAVQHRLPACANVVIPGPGLSPDRVDVGDALVVLPGCVDHRGRVSEPLAFEEVPDAPVVAVTSKFATRNPQLETEVRDRLDRDETRVTLGSDAGANLTFPERTATTVANAQTKPAFVDYHVEIAAALDDVGIDAPLYDLKSDGAMLAEHAMRTTPAHTLRSGGAASTLGLLALTDVTDAVCVDIGGTTTDVARVADGFLETDHAARQGSIEPAYAGVTAESLPRGGDTRVEAGPEGPRLTDRREGNAAAFGGDGPTVTDALHVTGAFTAGDVAAARAAIGGVAEPAEATARTVVDDYAGSVAAAIDELAGADLDAVVFGGVLAPYLADRILDATDRRYEGTVPDHADVAGAVGCAAARVSIETAVHIDSQRGVMTVSAVGSSVESVEAGRTFTEEEIETLAIERARDAALAAGADPGGAAELLAADWFNVVDDRRVVGQIVDARARVVPGVALDVDRGPS